MEEIGGDWPGELREDPEDSDIIKEADCEDGRSAGEGIADKGEGEVVHGAEEHSVSLAGVWNPPATGELQGKPEGEDGLDEENACWVEE